MNALLEVLKLKMEVETLKKLLEVQETSVIEQSLRLEQSNKELINTTVSRDYLNNVINSMIDMVVVIDTDFRINTVNSATSVLLEYGIDDIMGMPLSYICPDTSVWEIGAAEIFLGGRASNIETFYETRTGKKIPVILSISVLQGSSHEQNTAVIVAKDVTEHKQAEQQLKDYAEKIHRGSEDLNMFLQIASHDLQEPLRKVQTLGDRLQMKFGPQIGVEGSLYLNRMQNAAGRMQSLLNGLVLFSRITIKERNLKPVNLKEITLEVVSELKNSIERCGAVINISELPVIEADSFQIRQLTHNLITNALKFRKKDERLLVNIYGDYIQGNGGHSGEERNNGEMYQFTIEDNGIGFDEKYLDRIFVIFERLHNDEEYDGIGIGLAICRKIAELHEGAITVSSRPGRGSKFLITLPMRQSNGNGGADAHKE